MDKQLYFSKVNLLKALERKRSVLAEEWNAYTCWYGTDEEQEAHWDEVHKLHKQKGKHEEDIQEARKEISKDTLRDWAQEYKEKYE